MPRPRRTTIRRRPGLAPVELVLAIPLALFTLALSVVVGTAACWKIRATTVARNEIWSYRIPRRGNPDNPRPVGWPASASQNRFGGQPLPDLNTPAFQNPIVRGPMPAQILVNGNLFDPTMSIRTGQSHVQRSAPMLPRLGRYRFDPDHPLLDGKWQFGEMGLPRNTWRRMRLIGETPLLYQLPDGSTAERSKVQQAYQAIRAAPWRPDLALFDADQELHDWYYPNSDPWRSEVFYPFLRVPCGLDTAIVQVEIQRRLLPAIANVPKRITGPPPGSSQRWNSFLTMYRDQLNQLQTSTPPGDPAQISALQQKIKLLEDYLATLN